MILLDSRVGSKDLLPYFRQFDVLVESTHLDFADVCWAGNGPDQEIVMVGLERKRISDLVQSFREKRFAGHQLQGLIDQYQWLYLVVEGIYKSAGGEIAEKRGDRWIGLGISYREVSNTIRSITHQVVDAQGKPHFTVLRCSTARETVEEIVAAFKWWERPWTAHSSHKAMHAPLPALPKSHRAAFTTPERAIQAKYGDVGVICWKMAAQLPGIDTKAALVVARFRNPGRMIRATVEQWMEIDGIGQQTAERCVYVLR